MKGRPAIPAFVLIFAAELASCGGAAQNPQPCPLGALPLPAPPPMVYPQNGATGVPDGKFALVLGWSNGASVSLQTADGASTTGSLPSTPLPSPLPSPAATPLGAASPVAYSVPQLKTATAYSVVSTFTPAHCPTESETSGSFTTR